MRFISASRRQNSASSFFLFLFIVGSEGLQNDVCLEVEPHQRRHDRHDVLPLDSIHHHMVPLRRTTRKMTESDLPLLVVVTGPPEIDTSTFPDVAALAARLARV